MLSPQDGLVIVLVAFVLFGGKRIPEIMAGLGKGLRSFKKAVEGEEIHEVAPSPPPVAPPPPPAPPSGRAQDAGAAEKQIEPK